MESKRRWIFYFRNGDWDAKCPRGIVAFISTECSDRFFMKRRVGMQ